MRLRLFSVLVLAATVAAATPLLCTTALADKRVALVIGNSGYKKVEQLSNPVNDAKAVGYILRPPGSILSMFVMTLMWRVFGVLFVIFLWSSPTPT